MWDWCCNQHWHTQCHAVTALWQALVGCAQPLLLGAPTYVAELWFAPPQRATVVAITLMSYSVGMAVTFLPGIWIIDTDRIQHICFAQVGQRPACFCGNHGTPCVLLEPTHDRASSWSRARTQAVVCVLLLVLVRRCWPADHAAPSTWYAVPESFLPRAYSLVHRDTCPKTDRIVNGLR